MGCCSPIDAEPSLTVGVCPDCGGDVDKDGESTEEGCTYSPVECDTCGWRPCDWSC